MAKIKLTCVHCSKEVERYPSQIHGTIFCSRGCRSDYFKEQKTVIITCHFCTNKKRIGKSAYKEGGRHFCSRICKDTWQIEGLKGENGTFFGKSHSDDSKRKISDSKKSMKLIGERAHNYNTHSVKCSECGKVTYKIGYLISRSENLFCSVSCHGKWKSKHSVGEKNPNWNPELTDEDRERGRKYPEYYQFMKLVLTRDDNTCQVCGLFSKWASGLNVHHLNSYDWDKTNRTNPDNGITLCKECHLDFHREYGFGKNTEQQFKEFLRKLAS